MGSNFVNRGEAIEVNYGSGSSAVAPGTFEAGDPVVVGSIPAVAMTARKTGTNKGTFWFYGKYKAFVDAPSGKAGHIGAPIYFQVAAAGNPASHLTIDSASGTNIRWGYLLDQVPQGETNNVEIVVGW